MWLIIYEDGKKKGYLKGIPLLIRPTIKKWKKGELENEGDVEDFYAKIENLEEFNLPIKQKPIRFSLFQEKL